MGAYTGHNYWPMVFSMSWEDIEWNGALWNYTYAPYVVWGGTGWFNWRATYVSTSPTYYTYPLVYQLPLCGYTSRFTGDGVTNVNTCVADGTCNNSTYFCMDAGKFFWCTGNLYLGNYRFI